MHDPKFENEVQKKLEELSFSPSEAVWSRVERAVNEKKRRRVPFFWFFLLPSLGLAGAGMFYFSTKNRTTPAIEVVKAAPKTVQAAPEVKTPSTVPGAPADHSSSAGQVSSADQGSPTDRVSSAGHVSSPDRTVASEHPLGTDKNRITHRSSVPSVNNTPAGNETADDNPSVTAETPATVEPPAGTETASSTRVHGGLPGLMAFNRRFAAPAASPLKTQSLIQLKPKYSWEVGFTGGIGVSTLNTSLFKQPAGLASDLIAGSPTPVNANAYSYASRTAKTTGSSVQPGISYWAGITAQRPLSSSFTLSLGLDLHYYSARLTVGQTVYNNQASFYQASTLLNTPSQTAIQANVYPYYAPGDAEVFTNRYYFLELPASILWQVSHSRKLPLFWENGLSLSYLISTNSLYYSKAGVFYKDQGSMANKAQLNFATALLVGLPVRNLRLQVGPQVQYGLTGLQHEAAGAQHLFYGGIRLVLLPGKRKK